MRNLLFILLLSTFALAADAQYRIKGTVNSGPGKPLTGATVKLRGSKLVTHTGDKGDFVMDLPMLKDTLEVSFLGFRTSVVAVSMPLSHPLQVELVQVESTMSEVLVSTGYQEIPRERATGSFTKLDNELLNQQVSTNITDRLEAVAGAVTVDRKTARAGILIRGLSTIQGITGPLIVLDNFPYEGDLNNINPNDVESITLLKDAAAASIWGTKAGNGVIVITTKRGRYNQPVSVDFNANVTVGTKPDLSYARPMTSADYIGVEKMLFTNGFYDYYGYDPTHSALSPVVELLMAEKNGTITAADADAAINSLKTADVRNDFNKYVYRPLVNQQDAVNLHGGSEKMSWTASGAYDNNRDNLNGKFNRYNLHFQDSYRPVKGLELSAELYYTQSLVKSGFLPYGNSQYGNYPYARLADANGNSLPIARNHSLSYLDSLNSHLLDWKYYPLKDAAQDRSTVNTSDVLANFGLRYRVFPWLSAEIKYQYERQNTENNNDHSQDSFFARDLVNSFTQVAADGTLTYAIPQGAIEDYNYSTLTSQNLRGQLSFNNSWNKSNITAIAGAELRNAVTEGNTFRNYGVNTDIYTTGTIDYNTTYPDYISGNQAFTPNINGISRLTNRFVSVFANAAYTLMNRYTLSASARRDASNLFGVNTNDKWTPLWSAGAAWEISNEGFYHSDFFSLLKLRATYGLSGNVDQRRSAVTTISYPGNSDYTQQPYARVEQYANPDLRWERSAMFNIALDFKTRNDRLSGSIEYYRKKGTDLFGTSVIDYTAGVGPTATKNIAGMIGSGVDIELYSLNTIGPVKWTTTLNLSTYHDHITAYYLSSTQGSDYISGAQQPNISGLIGKPVYSMLSYRWAGLDPATGDPQGYINGQVSKDYALITGDGTQKTDLVYSGPVLPTIFGSFSNTVTWQRISLTASLLYKFGYYFRKSSIDYSALFNTGVGNSEFAKRWQKPGDEKTTNVPSMVYPNNNSRDAFYNGSTATVDKGDNIRLQYVTLAYELQHTQVKKLPFNRLSLFLNINNLGIIYRANKDHLDPDYPAGTLPNPLTCSIGLRGNL